MLITTLLYVGFLTGPSRHSNHGPTTLSEWVENGTWIVPAACYLESPTRFPYRL
jgi:hypothetical protein